MKLLALCILLVTLQNVVSTNFVNDFLTYEDWICEYELDSISDIEVNSPKRSVDDKNKNSANNITSEDKDSVSGEIMDNDGVGDILTANSCASDKVRGPGGECTTPDDDDDRK